MQGYFSQHVFPLNILFMYVRGLAINYAEHISSGYIYSCKCQICYRLRPIIIKHDFIILIRACSIISKVHIRFNLKDLTLVKSNIREVI